MERQNVGADASFGRGPAAGTKLASVQHGHARGEGIVLWEGYLASGLGTVADSTHSFISLAQH